MKKLIIGLSLFLTVLASPLANAQYDRYTTAVVGKNLLIFVDRFNLVTITDFATFPQEKQDKFIKLLAKVAPYCSTKGKWSSELAYDIGRKKATKQSVLNWLARDKNKISAREYVERKRVVEQAFSKGYTDPEYFGYMVVQDCFLKGR